MQIKSKPHTLPDVDYYICIPPRYGSGPDPQHHHRPPGILNPVWIQTKSRPIGFWFRSGSTPNLDPEPSGSGLDTDQIQTTSPLDPVWIRTRSRPRILWIRSGSRPNVDSQPSGFGLDPDQIQTQSPLDPVWIQTKSRPRTLWIRSGSRPNLDYSPS